MFKIIIHRLFLMFLKVYMQIMRILYGRLKNYYIEHYIFEWRKYYSFNMDQILWRLIVRNGREQGEG